MAFSALSFMLFHVTLWEKGALQDVWPSGGQVKELTNKSAIIRYIIEKRAIILMEV